MEYAIDKGIRLSNNSWGGGGYSQALYDTIEAAQAIGHIFVAAAGNGSLNTDIDPHYPSSYDLPNIISVAATDNDDLLGVFPSGNTSNYGPTTVDLGAPGVNIYSTTVGAPYGYLNGTSMAAPHVAGVVALVMTRYPDWTPSRVKNYILVGVRPVESLWQITVTGGVVNAQQVVDCNGNGIGDETDIAGGTSEDCSDNGMPDECERDCNNNGIADSCDILFGTSTDCNGNTIADECEPDCNGNGIADGCDLAGGTSYDCNYNLILDECDLAEGTSPDCNDNGVPDECDVTGSTSEDCDANGVPDDCQDASADCNGNAQWDTCDIAYAISTDCNGNAIPDECDISAGTSIDCNESGLPDECESTPKVFVKGQEGYIHAAFPVGITDLGYEVKVSNLIENAEELSEYAALVVIESVPAIQVTMVETYVYGGGGIIFIPGSAANFPYGSDLYPVESAEGWVHRIGTTVVDWSSPLVDGLGATSALEGWSTDPRLKPGAGVALEWSDGVPMAIAYAYGAGKVVYINDLWAWYAGHWRYDPIYGMTLMRNALRYVVEDEGFFDCNNNGALDLCDLAEGTSVDLNGNGMPDECDACGVCSDMVFCNGAEFCDVTGTCQPGKPPCGPPEHCDEENYACYPCTLDDDCSDGLFCTGVEACIDEICSYGDDPCPGQYCRELDDRCVDCLDAADCDDADWCNGLESCSADGLCEVGPVATDCNSNHVEDACDVADGWSPDCNYNTIPDECDLAAGTATDGNGNGVPDDCEVRKNRYISFGLTQGSDILAYQVTLTASEDFPGAVGTSWWVNAPDGDGIARLTNGPRFRDWSGDPRLVHVADCPIVPAATYEIRTTADGLIFGEPFPVATIFKPIPKHWGDVVGLLEGGAWTEPNRAVNMDDVMAGVQKFQQLESAPPLTWLDIDPEVPNAVLNFTDIMRIVQGFKGEPYPFSHPADCD